MQAPGFACAVVAIVATVATIAVLTGLTVNDAVRQNIKSDTSQEKALAELPPNHKSDSISDDDENQQHYDSGSDGHYDSENEQEHQPGRHNVEFRAELIDVDHFATESNSGSDFGSDIRSLSSATDNEVLIAPVEPAPIVSNVIRSMSSCGNGKRLVALTFDDGPNYETAELRAELDRLDVKATFFLSPYAGGDNEPVQCQEARNLVKSGHDLQLHSMTHPQLPSLSSYEFGREVQGGIDWMQRCRVPPPNMFRPPYGMLLDEQAWRLHEEFGLIIAQWNVECSDFDSELSKQDVFNNVKRNFEYKVGFGNSAIILMHDTHAVNRLGVVTDVVRYFRNLGYAFVTMNDCYSTCQSPVCKGAGGPTPYQHVYIP